MSGERFPDNVFEIAYHPAFAEPFVVVSETISLREPKIVEILAQTPDYFTALEIVDEEKEKDPEASFGKRFHILGAFDEAGNRLNWIIGGNED